MHKELRRWLILIAVIACPFSKQTQAEEPVLRDGQTMPRYILAAIDLPPKSPRKSLRLFPSSTFNLKKVQHSSSFPIGYFHVPELVMVRLSGEGERYEQFRELQIAPNLSEFASWLNELTDSDLEWLCRRSQSLRVLEIGSTLVTDEGVELIANHQKNLVALDISNLKLSEKALKFVIQLKGLQLLSIGHIEFNATQLAQTICSLKRLRYIYLHDAIRGGEVWNSVATLEHIEVLDAAMSDLDDTSLEKLAMCRSIKCLYLHGTRVTCAGLTQLVQQLDLRELSVEDGLFSKHSLNQLHLIRPNSTIRVIRDGEEVFRIDQIVHRE